MGNHPAGPDNVRCVAGDVEHAQIGPEREQPPSQIVAVHLGHDHVGHEHVDRGLPVGLRERLARRGGDEHPVARLEQDLGDQLPHRVVVLDKQNRAGAPLHTLRPDRLGPSRRFAARQVDTENSPRFRLGVDGDRAARLLDNAEHGGQTQPRSLAGLLGGEEGLEDVLARLERDSLADVGDGEDDVGAARERTVGEGRRFLELDIVGADRDRASVGHGVTGVHGQIGQDLTELPRIDLDRVQIRLQPGQQLDLLAEHAPEHARVLLDNRVDVHHLGLQNLLAAEGEQVLGQLGGTLAGTADLAQVVADRVLAAVERLQGDVGEAVDDRQEVVEVVGDTTGELADCLHLLGDQKLALELRALGHVAQNHDDVRGLAAFVVSDRADALEQAPVAVSVPEAKGATLRRPAREDLRRRGASSLEHLGGDQLLDFLTDQLLELVAERVPHRTRDQPDREVEADDRDHVGRLLDHGALQLLALTERPLGQLQLRDVHDLGDVVDESLLGIAHRRDREATPDDLSVLAQVALLGRNRGLAPFGDPGVDIVGRLAVFRMGDVVDRLPDQFLVRVTEQPRCGGIRVADVSSVIDQEHRYRRLLESDPEALLALLETLLGSVPLAEVVDDDQDGRHLAVLVELRHELGLVANGAAWPFEDVPHAAGLPARHDLRDAGGPRSAQVRSDRELLHRLADHRLRRYSQHLLARGVGVDVTPLPVNAHDGVGEVLQQCLERALAVEDPGRSTPFAEPELDFRRAPGFSGRRGLGRLVAGT